MKSVSFIAIVSLIFFGCSSKYTDKGEQKGEPTIYSLNNNDNEMNVAIKTANQTLDKFNEALKRRNPSFKSFALKTRFKTENGGEHIWVKNITLIDNKYFGIIDNLPKSTSEVKLGDTIQIETNNISDWMYVNNKELEGGFTIKLLRKRMTENERNQFDLETGLTFAE